MRPYKFENCIFKKCYVKTIETIDNKMTECCQKWINGICIYKMKEIKLKKDSSCIQKFCFLEFYDNFEPGCLRWIRGDCEEKPGKRRIIL
jgi:hypothetical protein